MRASPQESSHETHDSAVNPELGVLTPLMSTLFLGISSAGRGFQVNFEDCFSISVENRVRILMGITGVVDCFKQRAIFTIVIVLVPRYRLSLHL